MVRGVWDSGYVRVGEGEGVALAGVVGEAADLAADGTLAPVGSPSPPEGHSATLAATAPAATTPAAISVGRFLLRAGARRLPVLTASRPSPRPSRSTSRRRRRTPRK
jgi:hypothetical protein